MRAGVLLLALCAVQPLGAQTPEGRASLDQLRTELKAITDSQTLKAREAAGIAKAKVDRDNALLHLELGFVAVRLGEVTGDNQHYEDAGSEFEWAGELKPEWPFAWWGLGLAELAQGEGSSIAVENIKQILGKDYLTKAANAFARAAQADPSFAVALVDLAETALRQRINARVDVALTALRVSSHLAGIPPGVLLVLGRIEREAGSNDSALAAFRRYVAAGGDTGVGLFEGARAQFELGNRAAAESAYFMGGRAARSHAAQALYREDVGWTASEPELASLDSLARAGRLSEGLQRFWHSRDLHGALRPGDALAEHQRRFAHAWQHFRLLSRHRHYDITDAYHSDQDTFDDRGIIYLRQGEPDHRAVYVAARDPNESWAYERPDGNLIFHFAAAGHVSDFKLLRSLTDVLGFDQSVQIQTAPAGANAAGALFASRSLLDPMYATLAAGGSSAGRLLAEERRRSTAAIRIGTTTTDYSPHFANRLEPEVEVYALADSGVGRGRLLLVFGLPAKDLQAAEVQRGQAYPIEVRIGGVSDGGAELYWDTTRVFVAPHQLRGGEHLTWALSLPAPTGRYTLRMVVTQPGTESGAVADVDSVVVPPFGVTGAGPVVSDMVPGRVGSGLVWHDARDTIALNPLGTYPVDGAVELYYEVGGLSRGQAYHTRIVVDNPGGRSIFGWIAGLFGGGNRSVNVEFDGVSDSTIVRTHQRVDLKGLGTGHYRVTLDLSVPGREEHHTRTATLVITKP